MLFTLKELVHWLRLTLFELWVHAVTLLIFTVLLAFKLQGPWAPSWWLVFGPLFAGDGLNAYFTAIVAVRLYLDQDLRVAALRLLWSGLLLLLLFLFKMLLCKHLEGEVEMYCAVILVPLLILIQVLVFRSCYVT